MQETERPIAVNNEALAAEKEPPINTQAAAVTKKKFRIDKKTALSFTTGFVLAAILFCGVVFGVNPELLRGSMYNREGAKLPEYNNCFNGSFEVDSLYHSILWYDRDMENTLDRPCFTFITGGRMPEYERICIELNLRFGNYLTAAIYTGAGDVNKLRVNSNNRILAEKSDIKPKEITFEQVVEFINSSGMPWVFHDTSIYGVPLYYNIFQNVEGHQGYGLDPYGTFGIWDNLGVIRLLSGSRVPYYYAKCDGSPYGDSALTGLYGEGSLPNLTDAPPNMDFYMCKRGNMPIENAAALTVASDEICYSAQYECLYDLYLGEIVLISNIDKSKLPTKLIPCDGRSVPLNRYSALLSIIGFGYGYDAVNYTYFNLPDLRGKSPLQGADYYIAVEGLYPYIVEG